MSPVNIIFILFALAIFYIAWTQVLGAPWVPSSHKSIKSMMELADIKPGDILYDLGSGDGRIIIEAARIYKADARGIEIDPLRYAISMLKIYLLKIRDKATVRLGNFFSENLRDADVVIVYLLQETNDRLLKKLKEELYPGTKIISNTYVFKDLEPLASDEKNRVYLYRV